VPFALWLVRRFGIAGVAISQTALQLAIAVPLAYWQAFWILNKTRDRGPVGGGD
jgi:hypothetical protein